jgi:hypothetical protein
MWATSKSDNAEQKTVLLCLYSCGLDNLWCSFGCLWQLTYYMYEASIVGLAVPIALPEITIDQIYKQLADQALSDSHLPLPAVIRGEMPHIHLWSN